MSDVLHRLFYRRSMYEKINATKTSTAIVEQILDLIEQKKLKPGDKLPPETYMMKECISIKLWLRLRTTRSC